MFDEIEKEKKDLPEFEHVAKIVKNKDLNLYQIVAMLIVIIGFISGIFIGNLFPACASSSSIFAVCQETEFNLSLMLVMWGSSFLLATFLYGLGAIIKLLEIIANK
ncbi:MAG: hypothetical protein RSE91_03155 [Bacilli bacterium]